LAAVVRAEPEWPQLPDKIPGSIRELLHRCLVKDPKQRLQAIGEARIVIEKYLANPHGEAAAVEGQAKNHERLLSIVAATGVLAAVFLGILYWRKTPEEPRVTRSHIKPMVNSSLVFGGPGSGGFAPSPDGRRLAYVATTSEGKTLLWVRPLDSLHAQPLAGTEGAATPFWSPDSRFIGFFAAGKLKKIEASGGPPLTLCDAATGRGGTWNQEGVILFTPSVASPILRVSAAGGTGTPITALDTSKNESSHRWPYFLPDGRHFLYVAGSSFTPKESPTNAILVGSLDSKESKVLFHAHANAIYASGHILFLRQNTLMAQPFDTNRLELTGEAFPIADPVQEDEGRFHGIFSTSENGVLTYVEGVSGPDRQLIWVDRSGNKLGEVQGADAYADTQISPDGKRLSFTLEGSGYDIWVDDLARGVKTRLTFGSSSSQANQAEVWSPDGRQIAYSCARPGKFGLCVRPSDGSGNEEVILAGTENPRYPNDWSPDGKFLAYYESRLGISAIWMLPLSGERKPFPFLQSSFNQLGARFSPDGKWLAYFSGESGRPEVYVVPFPGPGGKWQVSTGGGTWPRWRRDAKEIFYLSPDNKVMAAEVRGNQSGFEIGAVRALFETRPYRSGGAAFDVSADGQRFIVEYAQKQPTATITLVVNWPAELKK
jgi:Tol biopolymer transport system component